MRSPTAAARPPTSCRWSPRSGRARAAPAEARRCSGDSVSGARSACLVQPLVGEPERAFGVARVAGSDARCRSAQSISQPSPRSASASSVVAARASSTTLAPSARSGRRTRRRRGGTRCRRRPTASRDAAEARQQRVAGRVAEGVVVDLEPVEVVDAGCVSGRSGVASGSSGEVGVELAAVAETGERVRIGFLARARPSGGPSRPRSDARSTSAIGSELMPTRLAARTRGAEATTIQSFSSRRHADGAVGDTDVAELRTPSPVAPASSRKRASSGTPSSEPVSCGERLLTRRRRCRRRRTRPRSGCPRPPSCVRRLSIRARSGRARSPDAPRDLRGVRHDPLARIARNVRT